MKHTPWPTGHGVCNFVGVAELVDLARDVILRAVFQVF